MAKKKKRSKGYSRRKGHSFERLVAQEFRAIGFEEARRHLEYQDMEANGCDLVGTGVYKIQCKKTKKYVSTNTIQEVQCSRELGDVPVLIAAGDNQEAMAVLPFTEFLRLIKEGGK